jgi:hypothetical protein
MPALGTRTIKPLSISEGNSDTLFSLAKKYNLIPIMKLCAKYKQNTDNVAFENKRIGDNKMSKNKSKSIFENTIKASKKPVLASITKLYDTSKTPERFAMGLRRLGKSKEVINGWCYLFKNMVKVLDNYTNEINKRGYTTRSNKLTVGDIRHKIIRSVADMKRACADGDDPDSVINYFLSWLNVNKDLVDYESVSVDPCMNQPCNVLDKEGNVHKDVNPSDMDELLSSDNSIVSDDYIYNVKDIKNFSFEYFSKLITQLKSVITNETNAKEDRKKIVKKLVEMANNSSRPYDAIFDTIEELGMFRETRDISDIVDGVVNELSDEMNKVLSKEVNK